MNQMTFLEKLRKKKETKPKPQVATATQTPSEHLDDIAPSNPKEKTPVIVIHPRSLSQTREEVMKRIADGEQVRCPVCDQNCKMYKRKLNAMQAVFLCWLVRRWVANGGGWIDVPKEYPRKIGGEYGKLAHWKLAELKTNDDDPSKRTSGLWRPTQKGIDFASETITVPKYVFLYNNELHSVSEEHTTIRESLGEKFDYSELMS